MSEQRPPGAPSDPLSGVLARARLARRCDGGSSPASEAQEQRQALIDGPQLLPAHAPEQPTNPALVDGPEVIDQRE